MAITTWDGFVAAPKQAATIVKTSTTTTVAGSWFSLFDIAGSPGAGTLAGTSTTAGVVPTDATAGTPNISAFGGGATGYLGQVSYGSNVACRLQVSDMLFKAGAYAFNATATLTAQPSYSGRLPNSSYNEAQLWFETVTAFTGNPNVVITYTNQSGTTGQSTTFAPGLAPIARRMFPIPLAAGDTGIQTIESVTATVASAGTFNLLVLRPLWTNRVSVANGGGSDNYDATAGAIVYADSALTLQVAADGTTSPITEVRMTIANG